MFLALFVFVTAHLFWAAQATSSSHTRSLHTRWKKPARPVAASWFASWHVSDVPLQSVSWAKYDMVIYSFAPTTNDVNLIGLEPSDEQLLPQFVQTAHKNNVAAILSIGGWSGSRFFSSAVATEANRTAFAKAVLDVALKYKLDGIEIDWEYPGKQGIGCNIVSPNDSAHFLLFLKMLRGIAPKLILSAAVSLNPFLGPDGNPMSNVAEFAKVLDYIEIMNYDVWGSFSPTVGPNAPLNDSCAPTSDRDGSAVSAVQAWKAAGFPVHRMILGVASYGHSFYVEPSDAIDAAGNLKLYPPFNKALQPAGDQWDGTAGGVDECGNPNTVGGVFQFWGLIEKGFLTPKGDAASGIHYAYDQCARTPYVYNPTSKVMVSYDDAASFADKGFFIRDFGLAGFAMWQTGGDSNDILLDSIRRWAGLTSH